MSERFPLAGAGAVSAGCSTCKDAVATLTSAVAERECGCEVTEATCDSHCDSAVKLGFEGEERPIIVRDDEAVVHKGSLSPEQALALLPS